MADLDIKNLTDEELAQLLADLRAEATRRIELMAQAAGLSVSYDEKSVKRRGRAAKKTTNTQAAS